MEGIITGRHYLGELIAIHRLLIKYSRSESTNKNQKVTNYKPELCCTNFVIKYIIMLTGL